MKTTDVLRLFSEHANFISYEVQLVIARAGDVVPNEDARSQLSSALKAAISDAHLKHVRHVQNVLEKSQDQQDRQQTKKKLAG